MDNPQLVRILEALGQKDRTAFETLYREMSKPVYTVILRITREETLAEDLLQEFFLKLYRTPPLPPPRNPRAYLFRMARNLAIDALRAQMPHADIEDCTFLPDPTQDILPQRLDLERAMGRLTPEERQIVTLHLNAGLKFREVAVLLSQPLGTVLWRYRKAIGTLRILLDGGTV